MTSKERVKRTFSHEESGGGYACAPTHQIQDNSPLENVLAFYETAARDGCY